MKKLLVVAAIGVAGLVSAHQSTEELDVAGGTYSYATLVGCTNQVFDDNIAWGEGTDCPTLEDAKRCALRNSQLLNEFYCGSSSGTPKSTNINP